MDRLQERFSNGDGSWAEARSYCGLSNSRARSNTASNITGVRRPVFVL
jgi:hypothetical protein